MPRLPFFGSVFAIDRKTPLQSLEAWSKKLGPIMRLHAPGETLLLLGSHELAADACDTARFGKAIHRPLKQLRQAGPNGLFTAYTEEPNWGKAHRILMPAFGPQAMRNYFDDMLDVASQMLVKWERQGAKHVFDLTDDMTRLTLDTIALCGMGYRFNSFYSETLHPFVLAMNGMLTEALKRLNQMPIQTALDFFGKRRLARDTAVMADITEQLIARHRAQGPTTGEEPSRHLLGRMLEQPDPQTGMMLDLENVQAQLSTFLVAGHETTSGMLSFAIYLLLEHPAILARAQKAVDAVLSDKPPSFEDVARLGYIEQILKETLRLHPTAAAFGVINAEPTTLASKYPLPAQSTLLILLGRVHRDPAVWPNPDEFDPDRFAPENRDRIPAHAWMPFGNGVRACIGRVFTMQEATLVLGLVLHRFDISYAAPYELSIKETLTVKPEGLKVRVRRRTPAARAQP